MRSLHAVAVGMVWVGSVCAAQAPGPVVPDWAQPGSATHKQVPPPADFHRAGRDIDTPLGIFEGQSDIGGAVVPGSASYDAATKQYTIRSAGYNIWYTRDEFRFLWKRMSGDVSLAADVSFPDPKGYSDRKAVLVIRQDLDDGAKEAVAAQHGGGLFHLAERADKNATMGAMDYRVANVGMPGYPGAGPVSTKRIGIEKRGDEITLWVSLEGEPMHEFGPPIRLHFDGPFYVGIGFSSHLPATVDAAVLSNVTLENAASKLR